MKAEEARKSYSRATLYGLGKRKDTLKNRAERGSHPIEAYKDAMRRREEPEHLGSNGS